MLFEEPSYPTISEIVLEFGVMKRLFLILFFCLVSSLVFGADQNTYISSSAFPGGDGSIGAPYDEFDDINWTTGGANSIFDWVAAGEDVFINLKRGDTFNDWLNIKTSGTLDHRLTIQPYGTGNDPIINNDGTNPYQVYSFEDHYITVTGLKFTGLALNNTVRFLHCNYINLYNCIFEDAMGMRWNGNNSHFHDNTFIRCEENLAVINIHRPTNSGASDTTIIERNTFTDCRNTGSYDGDGHMISLTGGTTESRVIKHILIQDNVADSCGAKSGHASIICYNAEDVQIYRNTIKNGFQSGITVGTNSKDVDAAFNVVINNAFNSGVTEQSAGIKIIQSTGACATCDTLENITAANNTIKNNSDSNSPTGINYRGGILLRVASGHILNNITIKNNICEDNFASVPGAYEFAYRDLGGVVSNIDIDNNNYYRSSETDYFTYWEDTGYSLAQWGDYKTASSQDVNSITADPLLISGGRILATSPAIGAGVQIPGINDGGELDIYGNVTLNPPNMGAVQGEGEFPAQIGQEGISGAISFFGVEGIGN